MEDKDILKKMANLFEESKKKKITDFDSGLLAQSFEPVTGSPEDRYEKWSARLVNIVSRLENLHKDDKVRLSILEEIDDFFEETLPNLMTHVNDFSEKARIIDLDVEGVSGTSSCVPESLEATIRAIREEQYNVLSNKAKSLLARARARLNEDVLIWHKQDLIEEVAHGGD